MLTIHFFYDKDLFITMYYRYLCDEKLLKIVPFVQVEEVKDIVTKEVVEKCGEYVCANLYSSMHNGP